MPTTSPTPLPLSDCTFLERLAADHRQLDERRVDHLGLQARIPSRRKPRMVTSNTGPPAAPFLAGLAIHALDSTGAASLAAAPSAAVAIRLVPPPT
jgi:hypothetical protein